MVEMTDLLSRPILRVPRATSTPERPVALLAALGAAGVAAGGIVICLSLSAAGWFAADTGSFGRAMRVGVLGWLLGNGSGLSGGGVSVGAVPLGLLFLCAFALHRVGHWAACTSRVRSWSDLALAVATMAGVYAAGGALAAIVVHVGGAHAPVPRTVTAFVIVAAVSGGAGLLRGSGRAGALLSRLPDEARAALLGGASGVLVMVAAGAVVFVVSLVVHVSTALRLAEGLHAGLVGGAILAVVGAALVPNAVLCAAAFVAGPGFSVGTGTEVSPSDVRLGLLPDFPLLAAVPTSADAWWLPALVLIPVLAGAVAGLVAVRRCPVYGIDRAVLRGALAGLAGGAGFGLLTALATGSVGPGRLQHVGPDVLATTAVCVVGFVLGGGLAAAVSRLLAGTSLRRRTSPTGSSDQLRDDPTPVADDPTPVADVATTAVRAWRGWRRRR